MTSNLDDIKAIVFDCDGTLVDSAPLYAKAWAAGFATSGHQMDEQWYRSRNGLSEHVLMSSFEEETGLVLDRPFVVETVRKTFLASIEVLSGMERIATLAHMAAAIMPTAVASGGPSAIVIPSLRQTGLIDSFNVVITLDDVAVPQPAPDLFLEAARRLGVLAEVCLVIEDSQTGIEAARSAGMRCIDVSDEGAVTELEHHLRVLASRTACDPSAPPS